MLEKQWQKLLKRRKKLKVDKEAYKAYLEKDKLRKAKKRLNEKKNWIDQQKAAHMLKECN